MSDDKAVKRAADEAELRNLLARYAVAVDTCDGALFASVFTPDARMISYNGPGSTTVRRVLQGHEALASNISKLGERYPKTFHFLGQSLFEINGDEASGIVYCIAHHLVHTPHGPVTFVLYVRYKDSYKRGPQGWKISEHHVFSDWSETRNVNPPEGYAAPGSTVKA